MSLRSWLVLWLLAAPVAAAPTVTAVELRSDAPLERVAELRELIVVQPGESLDPNAVARSLRNLHSYGTSGEIAAFAEPRPGGVAVVFGMWARIQVRLVQVVGDLGLKRSQLLAALPQRPEQPLSSSKVIRGVWALQDLYQTFGYRERSVRVEVSTNRHRRQAVVTYHVVAGPRARVGEVSFADDLGPFDAADLRAPLVSQPGRHHHEVTAANDVERLEDWLIERDYRRAAVEPARVSYDAARHRVDLEFPLRVGPRFAIEAPSVALKKLRRKGLLPFLETERIDSSKRSITSVAVARTGNVPCDAREKSAAI